MYLNERNINKVNKINSNLKTSSKEPIGAINEIFSNVQKVENEINNFKLVPPVGTLLFIDNMNNPATLYPGTTWQKIENKFIYGAVANTQGQTGGTASITLNETNLPKHRHQVDNHTHTQPDHTHNLIIERVDDLNWGGVGSNVGSDNGWNPRPMNNKIQSGGGDTTGGSAPMTNYVGGSKPIDIIPPYYKVHIWKRMS